MTPSPRFRPFLFYLLLAMGLALLYLRRMGSLTAPLVGTGDTEHLEWIHFIFSKLLHFSPFPQLSLFQDWVVFPTGGSVTYLPYSWEADYFIGTSLHFLGPGPWSYLYFFLAHFFLFAATTWLLRKIYSPRLALGIAFLLAFFNFYAQNKFPRHANMAYCHWMTLTVAYLNTLLVVIERKGIPAIKSLLPVGPLLLLGSGGQDPGYVIPLCLTLWSVATIVVLTHSESRDALWEAIKSLNAKDAIGNTKGIMLIALGAFFFFLYVPLNFQVAFDALKNPPLAQGANWTNPLRWAIPSFPFLWDPGWDAFKDVLTDVGDREAMGNPGWQLLFPAVLGIFFQKKKSRLSWRFLIVTFLTVALFHPRLFPTLKLFPWHLLSRQSVRFIILLAPLLVFFSVPFWEKWREQRPVVKMMVKLLFIFETLGQIFGLGGSFRGLAPEEATYFQEIKRSPGVGLLEWPYCMTAWSQEPEGSCYLRENHYFTYNAQRFHEKKTISVDLGRTSERERREWAQIPLHSLFRSLEQKRCFTQAEWSLFLNFYRAYDFAGVEIYPELLGPGCLKQWQKRLGEPSRRIKVAGRTERIFFKRVSQSLADPLSK